MTKAVLGMLCYDKPSVLEIRISQIKAKLSLLLLTWSLAKPRTESTQTLGHAKTLMCRVRKACPAPRARPSSTISWMIKLEMFSSLFARNLQFIILHTTVFVLTADRLIKLSFLHWQRGTRDDVGGIIWINRLSKLMTGEKLKKKRRRRRKSTYSKSLNYRFHFLRVQQMGKKAKLQRQKMNINTCYQRQI